MDWRKPGPLRAFRDRYVAPFAGVSYDLAPGAVGVDPSCLENAPELPGRMVIVSREDAPTWQPVRPAFVVVALTALMRDARRLAAAGGVVFSTFDVDDPDAGTVLEGLGVGESVFLNASLERLPPTGVRRPSFN